ncbi:hypothetical protein Taro_049138 [Colocasia esculenta]|uniref:Uncharacterized protein n=1 Tax=Colocasia esculenta TaxID=4460 RepID=A0A843XA25_COLES|nr:hypothetical protein [Colocasia esculenta]
MTKLTSDMTKYSHDSCSPSTPRIALARRRRGLRLLAVAAPGCSSLPPPAARRRCRAYSLSTPCLLAAAYSLHADDETSHHEGEGSYNETMRAVWINEGNKIEPAQASQFIIKTLQAHFPGPIHRFSNFLMDVQDLLYDMFIRNYRFTEHSDELRARSAWTTTARANFKHLLYNVRRNAEREAQLKRPPQFQELFDQTHKKKGTDDYISQKAWEVAESYSRGMDERYGDDSQRPELDLDIWVAASGAPKKGHVYGFRHSLGTARVISSCSSSVSHATSPFTTPTAPGGSSSAAPTMTPAQFREIVNETVSQNISTIVSQTVSQTLAQLGFLGDRAPPA